MSERNSITMKYGFKEIKSERPVLRRIKGKRTLLNWFPKDQAELKYQHGTIFGDYDVVINAALMAGERFTVEFTEEE